MKRLMSAMVLTFALACPGARAQDVQARPMGAEQVRTRVAALMRSIVWSRSLAAAADLAVKKRKMVFWMHVVGELDGGL